jgi:hypothetical protein
MSSTTVKNLTKAEYADRLYWLTFQAGGELLQEYTRNGDKAMAEKLDEIKRVSQECAKYLRDVQYIRKIGAAQLKKEREETDVALGLLEAQEASTSS